MCHQLIFINFIMGTLFIHCQLSLARRIPGSASQLSSNPSQTQKIKVCIGCLIRDGAVPCRTARKIENTLGPSNDKLVTQGYAA